MWHTTSKIIVVPILLTLVGLCLGLLITFLDNTDVNLKFSIATMSAMINVTSYVFALVVTSKYWQVDRLNAKTSSILAQIFPYIG
jgi:hypothetical protein